SGRLDADQQIPGYLARLIRQCLAKRPAERLQSASDLASALRAAAANHADPRKVQSSGIAVAVAILPLQCAGGQSAGGDAHSEFLGDGLTEQLIQGLSQVSREN